MDLLVPAGAGSQRQVGGWGPECGSLMVGTLREQPDCMHRVRFQRSTEVVSNGARGPARNAGRIRRCAPGPVQVQTPKAPWQQGKGGVDAWLLRVLRTNVWPGKEPLERFLVDTAGGPASGWCNALWAGGVFPGAQDRHAHQGPLGADGPGVTGVFGVRRHCGLAGVLAGMLCPRCGESTGGGSARAVTGIWIEFTV